MESLYLGLVMPPLSTVRRHIQGELTGVTALAIMAKPFMQLHSLHAKLEAVCDNQGVVNRYGKVYHIQQHREKNVYLYITQKQIGMDFNMELS